MMNHLREIRQANRLSQAKLAELANTAQAQIQHLERGSRKLTKEWAERLAPHLGVTAQELLFPDEAADYSSKKPPRKKAGGIPISLQLSNKEWIENVEDIWDIEDNDLSSFDAKNDKRLFAVKLLLALQNDLARPRDLAICLPVAKNGIADLANNDIVLAKTPLLRTNLVKYGLYKLQIKTGSQRIELDNYFINAQSEKITLDINDMKDVVIVAKVCYFVRLPQ